MSNVPTQTCRTCGKAFSTGMATCPHCRTSVPGMSTNDSRSGTIFVGLLIGGGLIALVLKLAGVF